MEQPYNEINQIEIEINDINFTILYCSKYIILTQKEQYINPLLIDKINLKLSTIKIHKKIDFDIIITLIQNIIKDEQDKAHILVNNDYMGIFEEKIITKYKMNKNNIYENYMKNITLKNSIIPSNIPKELLLNDKQFYQMIINEIERVNNNMSHNHIIVCNNDNIFDLQLHLKYNTNKIFELSFTLSRLYPFMPPIVEYIKPRIDINLVFNIIGMDIWDLKNWNYTVSLDSIITELAITLEQPFAKYQDNNHKSNKDLIIPPYNKLELKLCSLLKRTTGQYYEKIPLDINIITMSQLSSSSSNTNYWKAGTGYGIPKEKAWNISMYIDTIKLNITETNNILDIIIEELEKSEYNMIEPLIYKFIINQFIGITLLDFNKNSTFYHSIIKLVMVCIKKEQNSNFINNLLEITSCLHNDISNVLSFDINTNSGKSKDNIDVYIASYIFFIEMICKLQSYVKKNHKIEQVELIISSDINEQYKNMVIKEQFNYFELSSSHLYYKYHKNNIGKKSMLRIITETSSLKKSLPNNWDSSILFRISKTTINLVSFIIIGPKDTPYHNGIFEFHAYFPDGYPSVVPQVLINTTGGGKVRFNPNLYACGKVCLSLLGTWSGEAGESWIPDVSSFLQVLISIQSLILVDMPYFNEPGYEKNMNTTNGKALSKKYNDNIRLQTIRVAMIDNLKNKIPGYENFIINHFKLKKHEILTTVNTWYEESNECKIDMGKYIEELTLLLENM